MDLKQYQIVLVNLDPTVGSEIKKTRPCLIISPNEMNKYLNAVIIAPMTSQLKKYPTRVEVKYDSNASWIVLDQIRTIDRQRIVRTSVKLSDSEIEKVKMTIKEFLVD